MAGPVIGAFTPLDDISKQSAIDYIRRNGWTQDDVKLTADRENGLYLVIAKRRLW